MEASGIVRRVDDLGRIVIPKEIRSNLRIKSGECLEIYTVDDKIFLKKQDMISKYTDYFEKMLEAFSKTLKINILLTDTDKVIFSLGEGSSIYLNKELDNTIYNIILERNQKKLDNVQFFNDKSNILIQPLVVGGDVIGSTIFVRKNNEFSEIDTKIMDIVDNLLIKHVEN